MAMSTASGSGGATPNINVTPLIDVLLVLLIIFMVITPLKPSRFEAKVPAEPKDQPQQNVKPNPLTLVVAIDKETRKITLNNEPFGDVSDTDKLNARLHEIFKDRENNGSSVKVPTKWKRPFLLSRPNRFVTVTLSRLSTPLSRPVPRLLVFRSMI